MSGPAQYPVSPPRSEPLQRLPVGRCQVLKLDDVHAALTQLALADPCLGSPHQLRDLNLRQASVLARPSQLGEERAVTLRVQRRRGAHWTRIVQPGPVYTAVG
jgi:hypothetical protein